MNPEICEHAVCDKNGEMTLPELPMSATVEKYLKNVKAYLNHCWSKCGTRYNFRRR